MTRSLRRFWCWMTKPERITGRMLQDHMDELTSARRDQDGGDER